MPRDSAYIEALANDDEAAQVLAAIPEHETGKGPRLSEWSPERERLDAIYDRLGEVVQAVVGSNGGRPPKIRPAQRPSTAVDRARRQLAFKQHQSLVARLLPHKE